MQDEMQECKLIWLYPYGTAGGQKHWKLPISLAAQSEYYLYRLLLVRSDA